MGGRVVLRTCDGTDPNLVDRDGAPCDCGLIFDDVELIVVYPHQPIMSRTEKDELWDKVRVTPEAAYIWGSGSPTERVDPEP
jgi:hypothetical protein